MLRRLFFFNTDTKGFVGDYVLRRLIANRLLQRTDKVKVNQN